MKTTFPPHARALLHQTPAGAVVIVENGTAVTHLFFSRMAQPEHLEWEETPLLRQTADQLDEYFKVPAAYLTCRFLPREPNLNERSGKPFKPSPMEKPEVTETLPGE